MAVVYGSESDMPRARMRVRCAVRAAVGGAAPGANARTQRVQVGGAARVRAPQRLPVACLSTACPNLASGPQRRGNAGQKGRVGEFEGGGKAQGRHHAREGNARNGAVLQVAGNGEEACVRQGAWGMLRNPQWAEGGGCFVCACSAR